MRKRPYSPFSKHPATAPIQHLPAVTQSSSLAMFKSIKSQSAGHVVVVGAAVVVVVVVVAADD